MVWFLLTIAAWDFYSTRCSHHEKIVHNFHDIQIACGYNCRRVLKYVSKAHDILRAVHDNLRAVHDNRKQVDLHEQIVS